jgi:hypothetical protein
MARAVPQHHSKKMRNMFLETQSTALPYASNIVVLEIKL